MALSSDFQDAEQPQQTLQDKLIEDGKLVLYNPAINAKWNMLLEEMEDFFRPLESLLQQFFPAKPAQPASQKGKPPAKDSTTELYQGLLLLDKHLAMLPIEALRVFQSCSALARDFSLHTSFNRQARGEGEEAPKVNLAAMSFIVDIRGEDSAKAATGRGQVGRTAPPLVEDFHTRIKATYGAQWRGVAGDGEKVASDAEMAQLMQASQGLLYYGLGRMLSYIPAGVVAGANLSKCNFAMVMDKANNIPAAERQKYIDNRKHGAARALESSVAAAALLSLRGTKSVVVNTAYSTVDVNHAVLAGVLEGLKAGLSVGAAHMRAVRGLDTELQYFKYNAVLYGLPFMRDAAAK